jgi:uridine kinase
MAIIKTFDFKMWKPFAKAGTQASGSAEQGVMKGVDTDLKPEEEAYVRHFLHYADVLLNEENVSNGEAVPREKVEAFTEISGLEIRERRVA